MRRREALAFLAGLLLVGCAGDKPDDPNLTYATIQVKGMS